MRRLLFLAAVCFSVAAPAFAADQGQSAQRGKAAKPSQAAKPAQPAETLTASEAPSNGGFGAPVLKYTALDERWGVMAGVRGGWLINHAFSVGGGYYYLPQGSIKSGDVLGRGSDLDYRLGYGGVELEFILANAKAVHATLYGLLGWGNVGFHGIPGGDVDSNFYVFEPGAGLELNVTRNFRLGIGASYRLVSKVDSTYFTNDKVGGPSFVLTFKLGVF